MGYGNGVPCPLCGAGPWQATLDTGKAGGFRPACHCPSCGLVFIHPSRLPDAASERARYLQHKNSAADPGYRAFLLRIVTLLEARGLLAGAGLDYGCGPVPVLASLLRERGLSVAVYDPFFHPDRTVLGREYGFILCTEAAEHFHWPGEEFARLNGLLAPGGCLGLVTRLLDDVSRFPDWEYASDSTHVSFYGEATIRHLAGRYGWEAERQGRDLVLFVKKK